MIAKSHEQGRLEFAIVTDFLREGAVGNALDGITVIIHLASPLAVEVSDVYSPPFPKCFVVLTSTPSRVMIMKGQ